MKRFLASIVLSFGLITSASAETLTLQYPANPSGGGTAFWGDTFMSTLNPYLEKYGHTLVPRYLAGQRGKKSLKEYATNGVNDPTVLVIAHGGNGEAFLLEDVGGFDYRNYQPVVLMNTNIWVSINEGVDYKNDVVRFPATGGTGFAADMIAIGLMMCGPEQSATKEAFVACTSERLRFIPGFKSGGDRRAAFNAGQLDATRDTPQSSQKGYGDRYAAGEARVWFAHGIVSTNGGVTADPNAPEGTQSFPEVYEASWGVAPSGEVYDAYVAFQGYRDGFQKTVWTAKNSPYIEDIQRALLDMANDPAAVENLNKKLGEFPWLIGDNVEAHSDYLFSLLTQKRLDTLVFLAKNVFNYKDAYIKQELLD